MKFIDHLTKNKRKYIWYGILVAIFIALLTVYITAKFNDGNAIEVFYNNQMQENTDWWFYNSTTTQMEMFENAPAVAEFDAFLSEYIDDFFIYTISAIAILWIANTALNIIKKRISADIQNTLHVLVRIIVLPIFIIAYVNKFEPFTGSIIGVAATLGAAFGIAAAKSVGDLISGLYMVFSKNHNVGDYIFIPDLNIEGVVKSISVNYTIILQPEGTTAVIPNSKLRHISIVNIAVTELHTDEDYIPDFIQYGKRVVDTDYIYPLKWAVHSDDNHSDCVKTIEKTAGQYKDQLEEPVFWSIYERDRLNRRYLIKLTVPDSEILLTLVTDFTKSLESNYEKIKKKKE